VHDLRLSQHETEALEIGHDVYDVA
jgi:hypothetical protein